MSSVCVLFIAVVPVQSDTIKKNKVTKVLAALDENGIGWPKSFCAVSFLTPQ